MTSHRAVPAKTWSENTCVDPSCCACGFAMNAEEPLPLRARLDEAGSRARWQIDTLAARIHPPLVRSRTAVSGQRRPPSHSGIRPHKSYFALRTFSPQCNVASSSPSPLPVSGGWGRRRRRRRPRGCGRRTRRRKRRFLLRADRLTDCKNGHKLLYGSAGSQPTGGREGGREGRKL